MTDQNAEFVQGFAIAVAAVARDHDDPTMAANLIAGFGFDLCDFRRAKVDSYDLKVISKLYRTESALRRTAYQHLQKQATT